MVPHRHFINLTDLVQSSCLGILTLVHEKATVVIVSGLAHLVMNKFLATKVWNVSFLSSLSSGLSFVLNRFLLAGVGAVLSFGWVATNMVAAKCYPIGKRAPDDSTMQNPRIIKS